MKTLKKLFIGIIVICLLLSAFYSFWLAPRHVVPILMYHRFGYDGGSLFVTPENFQHQMKYLQNKNYNVIGLDELVEGIKDEKKFPRKTVVITIDDGYEDNFTNAYPVLKEYKFPAIIFLVANHIGNKKDFMNWFQVRAMAGDKIDFGAHTKNEKYLPAIKDKAELWDEIAGAKEVIEENLGNPIYYYCYPTGGFTEEVKIMVKNAGFKGACTTNRGSDKLNKDLYELNRVKIKNSDTNKPFSFRAKLSGYYNVFRGQKESH